MDGRTGTVTVRLVAGLEASAGDRHVGDQCLLHAGGEVSLSPPLGGG